MAPSRLFRLSKLYFSHQRWHVIMLTVAATVGVSSVSLAGTQNHKAHVHGNGKVDIAVESPIKLVIELDFPGDSILGFEHPARTPQEKQAQEQAFQKLRTQTDSVVQFDASLGCRYTVNKVEIEKGEQQSEHADVNASYDVICAKSVAGTQIKVPMARLFPKINKISVQILKESGQTQREISNASDDITL